MLLKLKDTVRTFSIDKKIVLHTSGVRLEIADDDGLVSDFVDTLDGKCSENDIIAVLQKTHSVAKEKIQEMIHTFDQHKLIEDASLGFAGILSKEEYERWHRNIDFFGSFCKLGDNKYALQKRIQSTRVTLLGLGGVGSHILFDLVGLGVTQIKAVDFDRIEKSNLNRQILYREQDIGKLKTKAAERTISEFCSNHQIQFIEKYLCNANDIFEIIQETDIVIGVVDRPSHIVKWMNEACVKAGIPLITGGVDTQRSYYFTVLPQESGCVACWENDVRSQSSFENAILEKELERDVLTLPPRPAIVPFVSINTGLIVAEFIRLATKICPPVGLNKLTAIPFGSMRTEIQETWTWLADCDVCGRENSNKL